MENIVTTIVESFKATNGSIFAIQENWGIACIDGIYQVESRRRCCGLSILLIGKSCIINGEHHDDTEESASKILGLSTSYVTGFLFGYDGADVHSKIIFLWNISISSKEDFDKGFRDGKSTWEELVKENLTEEESYEP